MSRASLVPALRAFVVAFAGVGLAAVWYRGTTEGQIVVAVLAVGGLFALRTRVLSGRSALPRRPRVAISRLEGYLWLQMAFAAVAAAVVVVAAVELAAPEGTTQNPTPPDVKELWGALGTAVTAFITASFISWTGEKDAGVDTWIRDEFRAKYKRAPLDGTGKVIEEELDIGIAYFLPESKGERAVYSDKYLGADGWDSESRRLRAKLIEEALSNRSETFYGESKPN